MSEKNLKSLRFHGLDDKYIIPTGGNIEIEFEGESTGTPSGIDADSLGGILAEDFATKNFVSTAKAEVTSYVNEQVRKAAPRNLLDNSDFRNPVNQREFTSSAIRHGHYCIDRWFNYDHGTAGENLTAVLDDGGLSVSATVKASLAQHFPNVEKYYGKTMTLAVGLDDGTVYTACSVVPNTAWVNFAEIDTDKILANAHTYNGTNGAVFIRPKADVTIAWVALYEGEYTAETLPEYQPKGYGAELAECQRYCIAITGGITIGYGAASSANTAYMTVDLPVSFHEYTTTIPTISGTLEVRGEGVTSAVESGTIWNVCGSKAIVNCTVPSFFVSHKPYVLRSTSKVLISKDL